MKKHLKFSGLSIPPGMNKTSEKPKVENDFNKGKYVTRIVRAVKGDSEASYPELEQILDDIWNEAIEAALLNAKVVKLDITTPDYIIDEQSILKLKQ